ncbi:MAG TPA: alkyl hydroperoxide reductase [Bacteroidales bacterium]|nr:MAG: hypothetical protein A2W98_02365 [Bacteroidetes bacterium GWF2_33_38]OFY76643.1 MAG: hypothetical protein A2265_07160 [Bacteroidetes bacterium RIFOXYA12_FULL_33_9]OFY88181.1 MAG: hypothetical protein A2236_06105 [Bacteroidetes bacterium RIFOXYA2_FULL_33_7]HBF88541.1 alkyl hydroperoxide reductase [Bacteroidales bacterium]
MKKHFLLSSLILMVLIAFGQDKKIPSVEIKDMNGNPFSTSTIANEGKPIVISFWATWCKPCIKELSTINDLYDEWKEETGVVLYAISIDDSRSMSRVAPFANGKAWEYEILLDPNGDFKREMSVTNVPHTFLIDGQGNIVWQHAGYADGDENELHEQIKKLLE